MHSMTRRLLIAGLSLAAAGAAIAQTPAPVAGDSPTWHGRMGHLGDHGRWREATAVHGSEALLILHHLDLSAAQREQIRAIREASKADEQRLHELIQADRSAFWRTPPTDPGYAAVVAAAKEHAAAAVDQRASHWSKIYAVLTPAQRAQLPDLVRAFEARRAKAPRHGSRHGGAADGMPSPPMTPPGPR
jgi:Spy/CpxP family protein refolding chaperone